MRLPLAEHLAGDWRVHSLASDFELLDVWRFPIEIESQIPLSSFMDFLNAQTESMAQGRSAAAMLFRLRNVLGRLFRWDDAAATPRVPLAIPDCSETTLRERLCEAEQAAVPENARSSEFTPVYAFENEALLEISNTTVHALMHLGRVAVSDHRWSPQMAVYVKPRGALGRNYMRLIRPFRHAIVYPALMRAVARGWPKWAAAQAATREIRESSP